MPIEPVPRLYWIGDRWQAPKWKLKKLLKSDKFKKLYEAELKKRKS